MVHAPVVPPQERRVEEALRALLSERDSWPTPWDMISSGHGALLREMNQLGGAATWRKRFGMATARGRAVPTEAEAELALRHFLDGREEWPTSEEFSAAGLQRAVAVGPGPAGWRDRLGFRRISHAPWTDEVIRRELDAFLAGRQDWPSQREFRDTGRKGLLDAIYNHGGSEHWAAQFGLTPRPHGRKNGAAVSPTATPHDVVLRAIEAELAEYLADKSDWPTRREFIADRRSYLLTRITRTGGFQHWAPKFGMTARKPGRRRVPTTTSA